MDIVVSGGAHPEEPLRPGRPPRDRTQVLLVLLVVGVFLGAACSAYTAWTVHQQREDERELQCAFISGSQGDLDEVTERLVDVYDCDLGDG